MRTIIKAKVSLTPLDWKRLFESLIFSISQQSNSITVSSLSVLSLLLGQTIVLPKTKRLDLKQIHNIQSKNITKTHSPVKLIPLA